MTQKPHILIVEDDQLLVDALTAMLEKRNVPVEVARTVDEGLEKIHSNEPDLILLDLVMPKKDGRDFLRALQKDNINIPIIVTTNLERAHVREECIALGAQEVLTKSNTPLQRLISAIEQYIGTSE